ncbi:hypothetical protein LSAT2_005983 [Lamellibrachia satsuma]|nr:hypothetical protein LSAT2_005983 [Lamellibrachia satsuma]
MKVTTLFVLAVCFLASITQARWIVGPELVMFEVDMFMDQNGRTVASCVYVDGTFKKKVEYEESLSRQTLNGRCVRCWTCSDRGMQCERTAAGAPC